MDGEPRELGAGLMADALNRKIKLGDFVVYRKYGDLRPGRVVRVTGKRVALAYPSGGRYDYRLGRYVTGEGVAWDRAPRLPHAQCVVIERGEPEVVERLEEWNKIIARLRPPLPEFLGRPADDVAYWTKHRVCGELEE